MDFYEIMETTRRYLKFIPQSQAVPNKSKIYFEIGVNLFSVLQRILPIKSINWGMGVYFKLFFVY